MPRMYKDRFSEEDIRPARATRQTTKRRIQAWPT